MNNKLLASCKAASLGTLSPATTAIAAYFLITEHRAHLFGILPFLPLAACLLLHFFHHRGHDHASGDSRPGSNGGTHQH